MGPFCRIASLRFDTDAVCDITKGGKTNGNEPSGFEDVLCKAADKLRGSMDASEYNASFSG